MSHQLKVSRCGVEEVPVSLVVSVSAGLPYPLLASVTIPGFEQQASINCTVPKHKNQTQVAKLNQTNTIFFQSELVTCM